MTHRRTEPSRHDEGFTLVEMLVVMLIIGILAAIAIPVFLSQKNNGYRTQLKSDLHGAAVAEETYAQDHDGAYLTAGTGSDLATEGFAATTGVTVTISAPTAGVGYCLSAASASMNGVSGNPQWYTNQGSDGGVIQASKPSNC